MTFFYKNKSDLIHILTKFAMILDLNCVHKVFINNEI